MSSSVQDPALLAKLARHLLVPVVVIDDAGTADSLGDALVAGGLPVAEVPSAPPPPWSRCAGSPAAGTSWSAQVPC